jgi:hypothetical protein
MRELRVGYWPLASDLKSPGDRRRLVFWAKARGHTVITDLSKKVDVVVASENSNFNSSLLANGNIPVIFDLIDAYLSPRNPVDDFARGLAKKLAGQISGGVKPFSHHIKDFCLRSDAVICSSPEQEALIKPYTTNTHVILDSHEEIPFIKIGARSKLSSNEIRILWEGQPATIRGIGGIASELYQLSETRDLRFDFVTDQKYYKFMNKYIERETLELISKDLPQISSNANIIEWSINNLVNSAQKCQIAIIPIDLRVPIQRLKPENRLLIMWRLGLPCLTTASPAYVRVSKIAGVNAICEKPQDWLESFNRIITDQSFAQKEVLLGQNYLHEFHSRESLLRKWDTAFESVIG